MTSDEWLDQFVGFKEMACMASERDLNPIAIRAFKIGAIKLLQSLPGCRDERASAANEVLAALLVALGHADVVDARDQGVEYA